MDIRWSNLLIIIFELIFISSCNNNPNKLGVEENNPVFNNNPVLKAISDEIKKTPENAQLYYQRGNELRKLNLDSFAFHDYKRAIKADSTNAAYYSAIGDLLFERKDITGSLPWIQKALTINPKDYKARIKIAKMLLYLKKYSEAIAQINLVLRFDAFNPEGYFLKGMVYKEMKDTAKAISSFLTSVQVAPDYKEAVIQLGLLYSEKGDSIALKYLDNANRIDSGDVFPIFAKGVYFQQKHQLERAKEAYSLCIVKNRHYVDAYFNLALLLTEQDSLPKALRQYNIVTKIDPLNVVAYYNRGVIKEAMDSIKGAIADYLLAKKLDPDYEKPKIALQRLKVKNNP